MALTAEERKARQRENAKRHYLKNREKILQSKRENNVEQNEKRRQRIHKKRDLVRELKNVPCLDCGGIFPPYCMDYDHIDDNKRSDVANLVRRNVSFDVLLAEIEKCELVCANCHRIRTHERRTNSETRSDSFECSPV